MLGVSHQTLCSAETGYRPLSPYLQRFAEAARRVSLERGELARDVLAHRGAIQAFLVLVAPEVWPVAGELHTPLERLPGAAEFAGAIALSGALLLQGVTRPVDVKLLRLAHKGGPEGVSRSVLLRRLHLKRAELDRVIDRLCSTGRLVVQHRRKSPKGRSGAFYLTRAYADALIS